MLEKTGNIFEQMDADAICFTSNGIIKKNGELVMGAGIAKAFKERWPDLPERAGFYVRTCGNHVYGFEYKNLTICSFPTKHHWRDNSDLSLIVQSAQELVIMTNKANWKKVYLTRPGCGLGGLDWEKQVKPAIKDILDDRFTVINNE